MKTKRFLPVVCLVFLTLSFFLLPLLRGKLPIPADTIMGLYHPYRDFLAKTYPNGIPFKNFLITDPVRQQYPWKFLSIQTEKHGQLPLWNPYTLSGTPLLGTFQGGALYPLNILFFIIPFSAAWTILILLQPLLAGIFLYLYLRNLRLSQMASVLGGFVFAFSGFSVAWMEWGTIMQTALWLPLILLAIDKSFSLKESKKPVNLELRVANSKISFRQDFWWCIVLIFSLSAALFAGHVQTFVYLFLVSFAYVVFRWFNERKIQVLLLFALCALLFAGITFFQWFPTLQFILQSARDVDQAGWREAGWFIPWQHLVQFLAPDFFGNPTTLNYWGVWNYAEFIGYIGLFPLILALNAILFRRSKETFFFFGVLLVSLVFALPTVLAMLPYQLSIPFLSTTQPTRLLFLVDFSLAILAGFGLDYFQREKRKIIYPVLIIIAIFLVLWAVVLSKGAGIFSLTPDEIRIIFRNLVLPTLLLFGTSMIIFFSIKLQQPRFQTVLLIGLIILTAADLFRFADKFLTFSPLHYLYPPTKTTAFLSSHLGNYRYMTTDSRILPPNFSIMYGLQTVEGYDPLYLRRYGELIAASERGKPNIQPPFGFNRILTPHRYDSEIINLLGVKYILSLSDISSPALKKVSQEGETRIYENTAALPRAFFVSQVTLSTGKQQTVSRMMDPATDLSTHAFVESADIALNHVYSKGKVQIIAYSAEQVQLKIQTAQRGFLVLTDSYYPTWKASLINMKTHTHQQIPIYRTDYNFRGIVVPVGSYSVEFTNHVL